MADRYVQPKIYNGSSSDNLIVKQAVNATNLIINENGSNISVPLKNVNNLSINDRFIESMTLLKEELGYETWKGATDLNPATFNISVSDLSSINGKHLKIGFLYSWDITSTVMQNYIEVKIATSKYAEFVLDIDIDNGVTTFAMGKVYFDTTNNYINIDGKVLSNGTSKTAYFRIGDIYLIN